MPQTPQHFETQITLAVLALNILARVLFKKTT